LILKIEEIDHEHEVAVRGLDTVKKGFSGEYAHQINYGVVVNMLNAALKREKILLDILNEKDDLK